MWTCRSQIVQKFLLLNSKSLLVKSEWVVRHNHLQKHSKLSSALGTVACVGTPENPQPLSLSPPPDGLMLHKVSGPLTWWRGWVKTYQAFVRLFFFSINEQMQVLLRNTPSMEVISSEKPVGQERALLGSAGRHRGGREEKTWAERRGKVANVKVTLRFVFLFVFQRVRVWLCSR